MTPSAPASSSRTGRVRVVSPVRATRSSHASAAASRRCFICSNDSAVAHLAQFSSGRQVGCAKEISTNLPRACGSQAANSCSVRKSGSTTAGPCTGWPPVPGLHASIVPSSVRTRGCTRSTCVMPRSQPRQVPYCSARAWIPQPRYCAMAQSLASFCCGVPVSRGPMESSSDCASRSSCELRVPSFQMASSTGSCLAAACAAAGAGAAKKAAAAAAPTHEKRFIHTSL